MQLNWWNLSQLQIKIYLFKFGFYLDFFGACLPCLLHKRVHFFNELLVNSAKKSFQLPLWMWTCKEKQIYVLSYLLLWFSLMGYCKPSPAVGVTLQYSLDVYIFNLRLIQLFPCQTFTPIFTLFFSDLLFWSMFFLSLTCFILIKW